MYQFYNPNPLRKSVGDCVVRALCKALGKEWGQIYADLCVKGYEMCDLPSSNAVWFAYLRDNGFQKHIIDSYTTFEQFAETHTEGLYIIGTGTHVVCVEDGGIIFDSWDSRNETAIFYFDRRE